MELLCQVALSSRPRSLPRIRSRVGGRAARDCKGQEIADLTSTVYRTEPRQESTYWLLGVCGAGILPAGWGWGEKGRVSGAGRIAVRSRASDPDGGRARAGGRPAAEPLL